MTLGRPIDLRLAREIVLAWLNKVPIEAMLDDDVMARELRPPNGDEIREAFRVLYAGYTMLALRVVDDWLLPPTTRHPVLLDIAVLGISFVLTIFAFVIEDKNSQGPAKWSYVALIGMPWLVAVPLHALFA